MNRHPENTCILENVTNLMHWLSGQITWTDSPFWRNWIMAICSTLPNLHNVCGLCRTQDHLALRPLWMVFCNILCFFTAVQFIAYTGRYVYCRRLGYICYCCYSLLEKRKRDRERDRETERKKELKKERKRQRDKDSERKGERKKYIHSKLYK